VSPTRQVALLTDTVGFIRKLPHHLVASFHSTLVEAIEADLLLHVIDASDPHFRRQIESVEEVLDEILDTPRPTTLVFNKIDRIADGTALDGLKVEYPGSFAVSARTGEGLDRLSAFLWAQAAERGVRRAS
jgi:GTP-binding protein HflX